MGEKARGEILFAPLNPHDPQSHSGHRKPYLIKTLQELNISVPVDQEAALRTYAKGVAERLASGQLPARTALDEIHSVVVGPLKHPSDLMGWCYLWEGNAADGTFTQTSEQETEQEARAFAKKWLAGLDHKIA